MRSADMYGNHHKEFLAHTIHSNQWNINNKDVNTYEDHFYPIGSSVSGTRLAGFIPIIFVGRKTDQLPFGFYHSCADLTQWVLRMMS